MNVTLTPAYGRDYTSAKAAKADYNAGLDFILNTFDMPAKPINKIECVSAGMQVTLRYGKLRKICQV